MTFIYTRWRYYVYNRFIDSANASDPRVEELADGIAITGTGGELLPGGGTVAGLLDHRICMASAVGGLMCRAAIQVDDMRPVATSFPQFETLLGELKQ